MNRWIMSIFCFFLLYSCNGRQEHLKEVLFWNNKTIDFSGNLKSKVLDKDTILCNFPSKEYKLLVYVGPKGCTACQLDLYAWKHFIDTLSIECPNLDVVFIIDVPNYKEFEALGKVNKFKHPVFYDTKGEFAKKNKFPENKTVQVLFLGKDNKVLLVGDPIRHNKLLTYYKKIIQEQS